MIDNFLLEISTPYGDGHVIHLKEKAEFKYIVRSIREYAHFSQTELAVRLGTNQATISQWEQGMVTPNLGTILLIEQFIDTPILIGRI